MVEVLTVFVALCFFGLLCLVVFDLLLAFIQTLSELFR